MLKFKHGEVDLPKAFNLSETDINYIHAKFVPWTGKAFQTTWLLQRIWIDENISDNAKCYLIFTMGRAYQDNEHKEGGGWKDD